MKPVGGPAFNPSHGSNYSTGRFMSFELHPDLARDGILIGRFDLCLVLLINDATYPWFVLVPQREHIRDLTDLAFDDYRMLWHESRKLSQAILKSFRGEKLNVAALGNVTPQLHVHHIVRFSDDPAWPAPIWGRNPMQPYQDAAVDQIRAQLDESTISGFVRV